MGKTETKKIVASSAMQNIFISLVDKLEALIIKSAQQQNAGMYLYKNDARTTLFQLEALCRMFKKFHNKKRFTKMQEQFKYLEDSIGQIDHFAAIANALSGSGENAVVKKHCTAQAQHHASILHAHITENWIGAKSNFIKIKEKISSAKWQNDEKLNESIQAFYIEELKEIKEIITASRFENIEADVHEIRRQLRWLSIYAIALHGKIQLRKDAKPKLAYKPYMSRAVISNPFNKMPLKGAHSSVVQLYAPAFYALSYVIAGLGDLKDSGLGQHTYANALVMVNKISPAQAKLETAKVFAGDAKEEQAILLEAKKMCLAFLKTGALDALVIG